MLQVDSASLQHKLGGASVKNNGHIIINEVSTNAAGDIVLKSVGGQVTNNGNIANNTNGSVILDGQKVASNGKNKISSRGNVVLNGPGGVNVHGTDIEAKNVYLTSLKGHGGIGISRYNGDRAVIKAHDSVSAHTDRSLHVSLGTVQAGNNVSLTATGGDITLHPEARLVSKNISVYAKKNVKLLGNSHEGAQVLGQGGHVSVVGENGVHIAPKAVISNTGKGAIGVFATEDIYQNGKIVTNNGHITLGAGNNVLGGEIFVNHGGEVISTGHGNVSLGSANDVHILNGRVGSNGGSVSLGAGDDVTVEGKSLVYAVKKGLSIGSGDRVVISGTAANTYGTIGIGSGNTVEVTGQVKVNEGTVGTKTGDISIGSAKDVTIRGNVGSDSGNVSIGSGRNVDIYGTVGTNTGNISLGSGDTVSVNKGGVVASNKGAVSLGSGNDIRVRHTGLVSSNSGPITFGAADDIILWDGNVQTHSGNINFHAGDRIVLETGKSRVESKTGKINLNAYKGDIVLRGKLASGKAVTVRSAKRVIKDRHLVLRGHPVSVKEHVKF